MFCKRALFAFFVLSSFSLVGCFEPDSKTLTESNTPSVIQGNGAEKTGGESEPEITQQADSDTTDKTAEESVTEGEAVSKAPLKRGEVPEEWREPQRVQARQIVADGQALDLTFDDLKFDIEVGEAFERSLLSEEVKELDGKEVTLSGYMRPAFKTSGLKGFIFVRDNKECCFGPQAAIYDCVMVKMKKGVTADYRVRPIRVAGDFYLKEFEGPDGAIWAIFNMKNATIK